MRILCVHLSCFPCFIRSRSGIAALLRPAASTPDTLMKSQGTTTLRQLRGRYWGFRTEGLTNRGIDPDSEYERCVAEARGAAGIIVMNYPKAIKAFYMRVNDYAALSLRWTCWHRGSARSSAAASARSGSRSWT